MEDHSGNIRQNIKKIRERIAAAAKRSGRAASAVTLLAVTKKVVVPEIRAALDAGIKAIGENKVQEAKTKFFQIGPATAWHMIGHVQTNKARHAAAIFDMIESVDSERIADALDQAAGSLDRELSVLIEINISGEEQKYGIPPDQTEALAAYVAAKPNLRLRGLMAMAPYVDDTELIRPAFRRMAEIFAALRAQVPAGVAWDVLSMGMTHDFEVAIEEGSTLVRIGTGIFAGER